MNYVKTVKSFIVILIIVFLSSNLFSQDTTKFYTNFRVAPLSILDPLRTTIQAGTEIIICNRISFGADYGFQFDNIFPKDYNLTDRKYFKLRTEIKYFIFRDLNLNKNKNLPYIGFEYFYIPDKYTLHDSWYGIGDYTVCYKTAEIDKYAIGGIFKVGYETILKNRLIFDFNFAAGCKHRIHNISANEITLFEGTVFEEWYSSPDHHPGVYNSFFCTFSFKIGYVIFTR